MLGGNTTQHRSLRVTFILRQNGTIIPLLSARDMHRKTSKAKEKPMSKLKSIPAFGTEVEERKSWKTHDSRDYVDCSKA
jgi:hypothetical protein